MYENKYNNNNNNNNNNNDDDDDNAAEAPKIIHVTKVALKQ